jgi:hypothetical protein
MWYNRVSFLYHLYLELKMDIESNKQDKKEGNTVNYIPASKVIV